MSKTFQVTTEEYEALEVMGKEHGLTVDQEVQLACLRFFYTVDRAFYEEAKPATDPKVLEVFEREYI